MCQTSQLKTLQYSVSTRQLCVPCSKRSEILTVTIADALPSFSARFHKRGKRLLEGKWKWGAGYRDTDVKVMTSHRDLVKREGNIKVTFSDNAGPISEVK